MKVASIAPYTYLPYQSGGQKLIAQFYEYLAKEAEVHVVGTKANDQSLVKGYKLHPLLSTSILRYANILLFFPIRKLMKANKINVIIFEHPYLAFLMWMLKMAGFTIVLHTHNIEFLRFKSLNKWWWPLLRLYERVAFKISDKIFFIGKDDMDTALREFPISSEKCHVIPFGIANNAPATDKASANLKIREEWELPSNTAILLFTGHYSYQPNVDAVRNIIEHVAPQLQASWQQSYKIIITGKGLPEDLQVLIHSKTDIVYAGFVSDIDTYFKGADVLLNAVLAGGGVKTKLIEAIGNGTTVVSTVSGALGVDRNVCGNKLLVTADNDWEGFAGGITKHGLTNQTTDRAFYQSYYWGNIARKAKEIILPYA